MTRLRKLTPEQICQVPGLREGGHNISEIARGFGVTPAAIRRIIEEETWLRYRETDEPPGKPDRCPDCGGKVANDLEPCRVCTARRELGLES